MAQEWKKLETMTVKCGDKTAELTAWLLKQLSMPDSLKRLFWNSTDAVRVIYTS